MTRTIKIFDEKDLEHPDKVSSVWLEFGFPWDRSKSKTLIPSREDNKLIRVKSVKIEYEVVEDNEKQTDI